MNHEMDIFAEDPQSFNLMETPELLQQMRETICQHGYILEKQIGSGGFSVVFLVESIKYHRKFVIKVRYNRQDMTKKTKLSLNNKNNNPLMQSKEILLNIMNNNSDDENDVENNANNDITEISLLLKLSHPNIISMYEYFTDPFFLYIVLEYCPGGNLGDYIKKNGPLPKHLLYPIMSQIASALELCHKHNIAHRDIKPENIFIDCNGRPKLADFGLSSEVHRRNENENGSVGCQDVMTADKLKDFCGSRPFMSPELINKRYPCDPFKADIWALGITYYALIVGDVPWKTENRMEMDVAISVGMVNFTHKDITFDMVKILKKMIDINPSKRVSIEWIVNQPIFKDNLSTPISLLKPNKPLTLISSFEARRRNSLVPHPIIASRRSSLADSDIHCFKNLPIKAGTTKLSKMHPLSRNVRSNIQPTFQ